MLNAEDKYTLESLNRLTEAIRRKRALVVWVGAGASRWAGLPSWHDTARQMRKGFRRTSGFSDQLAGELISSQDYPALFQLCKDADKHLYNTTLLREFISPQVTPLYAQFILKLKALTPVQVVTTNIDLCLEQHLGAMDVIERSDLERCNQRIQSEAPFIAKLHGSVSSVESMPSCGCPIYGCNQVDILPGLGYLSGVRRKG